MTETETVDHPHHYQAWGGFEAIDVMERYGLGPHLFVAMKHLLRAGKKGDRITDLRKAQWYLTRIDGHSLFIHGSEGCYADAWMSPTKVADAFGLDGYHRRAVICILTAALRDGDERRDMISCALGALYKEINGEPGRTP